MWQRGHVSSRTGSGLEWHGQVGSRSAAGGWRLQASRDGRRARCQPRARWTHVAGRRCAPTGRGSCRCTRSSGIISERHGRTRPGRVDAAARWRPSRCIDPAHGWKPQRDRALGERSPQSAGWDNPDAAQAFHPGTHDVPAGAPHCPDAGPASPNAERTDRRVRCDGALQATLARRSNADSNERATVVPGAFHACAGSDG
jgi:hypothetical protein